MPANGRCSRPDDLTEQRTKCSTSVAGRRTCNYEHVCLPLFASAPAAQGNYFTATFDLPYPPLPLRRALSNPFLPYYLVLAIPFLQELQFGYLTFVTCRRLHPLGLPSSAALRCYRRRKTL